MRDRERNWNGEWEDLSSVLVDKWTTPLHTALTDPTCHHTHACQISFFSSTYCCIKICCSTVLTNHFVTKTYSLQLLSFHHCTPLVGPSLAWSCSPAVSVGSHTRYLHWSSLHNTMPSNLYAQFAFLWCLSERGEVLYSCCLLLSLVWSEP